MDTVSITGAALLAKTGQTQQAMSMSLMKMAADQQKQIASMLAQNAAQTQQPISLDNGFNFSIYA